MPFVLDASTTLAWIFDDEESAVANAASERSYSDQAVVPHHWFLEVVSGMLKAERQRRIDVAGAAGFLDRLTALDLESEATESSTLLRAVLPLARAHRLSMYDAAYLELAQRRGLDLAAIDGPLVGAARRQGVTVIDAAETE